MIGRPETNLVEYRPFIDPEAAFTLPLAARTNDYWDAWAFAAVESALALEAWTTAGPDEKELGYCAYLACLDREEQAATAVAERVDPVAAARLRAGG